MTPEELRRIGERLYGPDWIGPMAEALPVTERAVRYWLAGERMIRPVIARRIRSLKARPRNAKNPPAGAGGRG